MKARDIIEAEDPKSIFKQISAQPYQFIPRRLTPREIERLGRILGMGPLEKRPIDDKFLDWGYIEYYGDYEPGDEEFQRAVDAKAGFAQAFYGKDGMPRPEWMDLPNQYKPRGSRKFYWRQQEAENPKSVFKKATAVAPRSRAEVSSSHGELTVDNLDGRVIEWKPYEPDESGYGQIERFDLDEWQRYWGWVGERPLGYDILDLGYWMKNGDYEPPENEWREHVRGLADQGGGWNIPDHVQPHQEEGLD